MSNERYQRSIQSFTYYDAMYGKKKFRIQMSACNECLLWEIILIPDNNFAILLKNI